MRIWDLYSVMEDSQSALGYKVMPYDPDTGTLISGANSRLNYSAKVGQVVKMPGKGVYMSLSKDYVLTYYTGLAPHEMLVTFQFNPQTITRGNLTDKETEVAVPAAKIVNLEQLESDEEFDEDMDSANNMSPLLGRGPTIYPLPKSATEYDDIDSIPRGGKKKLKIRRRPK